MRVIFIITFHWFRKQGLDKWFAQLYENFSLELGRLSHTELMILSSVFSH